MARKRKYYGEEAERLTAKEAMAYRTRLAAMSDADLLACMVEPPAEPVTATVQG